MYFPTTGNALCGLLSLAFFVMSAGHQSLLSQTSLSLSTMKAHDGEHDAEALICMCIAKAGKLDILKNPQEAIQLINEYANGGFYHIMKLMENGENNFNDLEKVKQEIFSRD